MEMLLSCLRQLRMEMLLHSIILCRDGSCPKGQVFEEACNYFWAMRSEGGIFPDEASFSTVLHAVASTAAMDQGKLVHNQVIKTGYGLNILVVNSLVKMYGKCGSG